METYHKKEKIVMLSRFKNRNILITGAASGIGEAAAIRIAQEGGNLALLDINTQKLEQVAQDLLKKGCKVIYGTCDVSDAAQTKSIIEHLIHELGGINALSHNAGMIDCFHTHEMSLEAWNHIISINLTGTFNVNKAALPHLLKNPHSYLVNASSIAADQPHPWMAAYSATKGAIRSFTRSLFIEYFEKGLRANCILPGSIESQLSSKFTLPPGGNSDLLKTLIPLGKAKMVAPQYVAGVVALLTSDDAYHINGTEIIIDGGGVGDFL